MIFWETTSLSNRCLLSASIPGQASVAKAKAKKKEKDDASAEVVPQTVTEKVTDAISDALKEAGHARTSAITLSGLEFADNFKHCYERPRQQDRISLWISSESHQNEGE